jgi:hypothetical protein
LILKPGRAEDLNPAAERPDLKRGRGGAI